MALTSLGTYLYIPELSFNPFNTAGQDTMDAAGEMVYHVAVSTGAYTVRNAWIALNSVTSSQSLRIAIEGFLSYAYPDGNIKASGNGYVDTTGTLSGSGVWNGPYQFNSDVSLSAGDRYAVTIRFASTAGNLQPSRGSYNNNTGNFYTGTCLAASLTSGTVATGSVYRIRTYTSDDDFTNIGASSNAVGVIFKATGTTPTHWDHASELGLLSPVSGGAYCVALECSDGSYVIGNMASYPAAVYADANGDPDIVGNHITMPFTARCIGMWARMDPDNEPILSLRDASGAEITSISSMYYVGGSSYQLCYSFFSTPQTLNEGTAYKACLRTDSTSGVGLYHNIFPEADALKTIPGGQNFYYTYRSYPGGVWSTNTSRAAAIGLIFDQIDIPAKNRPPFGDRSGGKF